MRPLVSLAICLTLVGCGGSASVGGATPPTGQRSDTSQPDQPEVLGNIGTFDSEPYTLRDDEIIATPSGDASFGDMLNNVRLDAGAGEVRYDARLDSAAQVHAEDMITRGYFAHRSPEGLSARDRMMEEGYNPRFWGENIAARQQTAEEALVGWQNSPSHNDMMTAEVFEDFGFGYSADGRETRWVLVMGTEME